MSITELFLLSIGLAMDAFAVSIGKGLAMDRATFKKAAVVGLWFGSFQALMPLAGYLLGSQFNAYIAAFSDWIAFALLVFIGGKMIREAVSHREDQRDTGGSLSPRTMLVLALATSIDAMAAGVTFAFLNVNAVTAACVIGVTTFVLSAVGVKAGNLFGMKHKSKAEIAGGVILIALGIKILAENLLSA